jgi:predicted AAA+ superfamily ATPase
VLGSIEWVVIDQVQRAPKLLDTVYSLIEAPWNSNKRVKFALTGSSARKLKRGAANLLAGRAYTYNLHPLTYQELAGRFNLIDALAWGTLPTVWNIKSDEERKAYLKSYTATYIHEEIAQEQLVRNLIPFRKFLPIAAQSSGTIINYNSIARDLGVDWTTIRNYFEILEDTLIGFKLPAFSQSVRKQQILSPKFYLFDLGVKRSLDKTLNLVPSTGQIIGPLFEHFIICEAIRLNDYLDKDFSFSYLRTQGGAEIDLVIERPGEKTVFVEIKSTTNVTKEHLRHLRDLASERDDVELLCLTAIVHKNSYFRAFLAPLKKRELRCPGGLGFREAWKPAPERLDGCLLRGFAGCGSVEPSGAAAYCGVQLATPPKRPYHL